MPPAIESVLAYAASYGGPVAIVGLLINWYRTRGEGRKLEVDTLTSVLLTLRTEVDRLTDRTQVLEDRIASLEQQAVEDTHIISSLRAYIRALLLWISAHMEGADYPRPDADLGI